MFEENKGIFSIGIVVLLCLFGFSSCNIVDPGYRGVKVTLGSVSPDVLGEGLCFKWPLISTVTEIPVKQITRETQATCFSSDLQTVTLSLSILYRIPDNMVVDLYQKYSGDPYTTLVEPRIQEAVKKEVSACVAEDVVKKRDKIKAAVLPNIMASVAGLLIVSDVVITNIDFTDALEKSIETKQIKQQEAQAKVYELQKAEKEAEIAVTTAKGEAEAMRLKAEAISRSPGIIQLEIIKKWDGKAPQYISTNSGGANILLPVQGKE